MIHDLFHPMHTIAEVLEVFGLWFVGSRVFRVVRKVKTATK